MACTQFPPPIYMPHHPQENVSWNGNPISCWLSAAFLCQALCGLVEECRKWGYKDEKRGFPSKDSFLGAHSRDLRRAQHPHHAGILEAGLRAVTVNAELLPGNMPPPCQCSARVSGPSSFSPSLPILSGFFQDLLVRKEELHREGDIFSLLVYSPK